MSTKGWFAVTEWQTFTPQPLLIEIRHDNVQAASSAEAVAAANRIRSAQISAEGRLSVIGLDGAVDEVPASAVRVLARQPTEACKAFKPEPATEAGKARIAATFSDPAYSASDEDYSPVSISLADLARMPGGTGRLGSLSVGAEPAS